MSYINTNLPIHAPALAHFPVLHFVQTVAELHSVQAAKEVPEKITIV